MKNTIEIINLAEALPRQIVTADNVWTAEMMLVLDSHKVVDNPNNNIGQPYLLTEGRVIRIVSGQARMIANLQTFSLHSNMAVFLPPNSIIQYEEISPDFRLQAVSYKTSQAPLPFHRATAFVLDEVDFERIGCYFNIMLQVFRKRHYSIQTLNLLLMALTNDLHHTETLDNDDTYSPQNNRQEIIFNRFIDLVNEHGARERKIDFYAAQLSLSSNYLSAVIKARSGRSILDWVGQATIQQAKILLRHTDLMIYEVAYRLNFSEPTAFNRWFKQQLGLTPMQYRKNNY
ncbi:MAG: helix-turn-helix domain-containing protein [Alistipes sp.]|nr:helix-turn-helix domain-containing protein [Alistipes sp.]